MKNLAPIWPRHPNGRHKALGEMTREELKQAMDKCELEVYTEKDSGVKAFIEQQTFLAEERLADGQDCDFEE